MARVRIANGLMLDYLECGDRQGAAILFVHGYLDSWRVWESSLPFLPHNHRLVFVTQRGFGDSDKPEQGYRQIDFVEDIKAFMDAVQLDHAVIVGHSMGGLIAHYLALLYPERVDGLILVATSASASELVEDWSIGDHDVMSLTDPIDPDFVRQAQSEDVRAPVPTHRLEGQIFEAMKVPARVWGQSMQGMFDEDHRDRLGDINVPVQILYPELDMYFTRDQQDELLALLPNASLKVYPGAGHGLQWEFPEEFGADVSAFANDLARRIA
ncbi:MAG: alpha/beta hydrolase [Pseudomonadota bacterium]